MEDIGGMLASSTVRSRMLEAVREKMTGGIIVDGVVLEEGYIGTQCDNMSVSEKEICAIVTYTKLIGTPNTL